jgi:hypothetical protein
MEIMQNNVSSNETKLTPQYFFITLGVFISLWVISVSFINLIFSALDKAMPDVLNAVYSYGYNSYDYNSIRTTLAIVIIFAPIFMSLMYFWNKKSRENLSKNNAVLRKWTVYIILFFTVLSVAVTLSTLVRYFIAGEITNRFMIKSFVVLTISGMTFFYFFRHLFATSEWRSQKFMPTVYVVSVPTIILLGVIYSFMIVGSPASQRAYRIDAKRVEDLQNIQGQITNYFQQKQKLPENLGELINPLDSYTVIPKDPEFQKGYTYSYKKTGDLKFSLCAHFAKPSMEGLVDNGSYGSDEIMPMLDKMTVSSYPYYGGGVNSNWVHLMGNYCFSRKIDKDLYPPYNPVPVSAAIEPAVMVR